MIIHYLDSFNGLRVIFCLQGKMSVPSVSQGQQYINELEYYISKVNEINDVQKKWFTADLNYFDNCLKALNTLLAQQVQQPSKELVDENEVIFKILKSFPDNFIKAQMEIKVNTIPKLKDLINSVAKDSHSFLTKVSQILKTLRRMYSDFNAVRMKIKQKQSQMEVFKCLKNCLNVTGKSMNDLYYRFYSDVELVENNLMGELNNFSNTLLKNIKEEKEIIEKATYLIFNVYSFDKTYSQSDRILKDDETVEFYKEKISGSFYGLRCSLGPPLLGENEMVNNDWKEDGEEEFYARVWVNYKAQNNEEVDASRKSLVKVTKTSLHTHWEIEKLNGDRGYFPCSYLEPVQD